MVLGDWAVVHTLRTMESLGFEGRELHNTVMCDTIRNGNETATNTISIPRDPLVSIAPIVNHDKDSSPLSRCLYARRTRQGCSSDPFSHQGTSDSQSPGKQTGKQRNASPALALAAIVQKVEMRYLGANDMTSDADWLGGDWATSGNETRWDTPCGIWILGT